MKATPARPAPAVDWNWAMLAGLLCAGFLILRIPAWKTHNPQDLLVPDSVEYAVSAHHLAKDGRLEVTINGQVHPLRFAPGYPLLIAAVYRAVGLEVENAVYASLLSGLVSLALLFLLARRFFPAPASALAALTLLSTGAFVYQSQTVMSDALALALVLGVLTLSLSIFDESSRWPWRCLMLGCLLGYAVTVRSSLVFLPACAGLLLWRADWPWRRKALAAALASLGGLPWAWGLAAYNLRHFGAWNRSGYAYYCSNPYDLRGSLFSWTNLTASPLYGDGNLAYYLKSLFFLFPDLVGGPAYAWSGCAIVLLAARGCRLFYARADEGSRARRDLVVFGLTWMGSQLVLYGLYVYREPTGRFFTTYMPFAALFFVQACLGLYESGRSGLRRTAAAAALAALVGYRLLAVTDWNRARQAALPQSPFLETVRWLKANTEPDAAIVSGFDGVYIGHYVIAGSARLYVPSGESVEYRDKYISPKPPRDLSRIPPDPLLHRYPGALENGAQEIIPYSAAGSPFRVVEMLDAGRKIYLDEYSVKTGFPEDYFVLKSIFTLEPAGEVAGRPILRLKKRFVRPEELKARYVQAWLHVAEKCAERGLWSKAELAARLALIQAPGQPEALRILAARPQESRPSP